MDSEPILLQVNVNRISKLIVRFEKLAEAEGDSPAAKAYTQCAKELSLVAQGQEMPEDEAEAESKPAGGEFK